MSHVPAVERVRTARIVVRSFTPAFGKADVKSFDYSQIDKFARAVPVNATTSVKQLASYLWASVPRGGQFTSLPAPSNNIVPFIRAVYTWTATNIKYDIRWFTQRSALPPQTADLVLKNRIGVCEGYSNLFVALCIAAGMGADVVEKKIGAAKDVTFAPGHVFLTRNKEGKPTGHAWNSVSLNGRPFMIDSTWGAGTVGVGPKGYMFEPGFQPFYFLMDPREAIYTHFPSNPVDQNLSPQCTEADFLNLPMTKPTYFEFYAMIYGGRNLISGSTIELPETGDGSVTVYLKTSPTEGKPEVKGSLRYPLSRTSSGNPNHHSGQVGFDGVFVRYEGLGNAPGEDRVWMVTILFRLPGPGEASVNWFIMDDEHDIKQPSWLGYPSGTHAGGFLVRQKYNRAALPFPKIFANKDDVDVDVVEPIDGVLQRGSTQRFLLREFHMPNIPPPQRNLILIPPSPGGINLANATEIKSIPDQARGLRDYLVQGVKLTQPGDWMIGYKKNVGNQIQIQFIAKWIVQ